MMTRSTSFSAERARARSVSASAAFTFSTQWESIPCPWEAHAARLCCGSASSTMTLRPMAASSAARFPAMVDFPTPPFRPATAMIAIEVGITIIAYSGADAVGGMQARISELRSDLEIGHSRHKVGVADFAGLLFPDALPYSGRLLMQAGAAGEQDIWRRPFRSAGACLPPAN